MDSIKWITSFETPSSFSRPIRGIILILFSSMSSPRNLRRNASVASPITGLSVLFLRCAASKYSTRRSSFTSNPFIPSLAAVNRSSLPIAPQSAVPFPVASFYPLPAASNILCGHRYHKPLAGREYEVSLWLWCVLLVSRQKSQNERNNRRSFVGDGEFSQSCPRL